MGIPFTGPPTIGAAAVLAARASNRDGFVDGMHTFGASAPLKQLLTKFGFTPERVALPFLP